MPAVVVVVVVVVVGGTVSQWSVDGHCELPTTTAAAHVTPTSQPAQPTASGHCSHRRLSRKLTARFLSTRRLRPPADRAVH